MKTLFVIPVALLVACSSEHSSNARQPSPPPVLTSGALASVADLRLDKTP